MVDSHSDNWLEAGGNVSDKLGEDLINEYVAYNKIHAQHDWDVEDAHEILMSEQAEYSSNWVKVELAAPEKVAEHN